VSCDSLLACGSKPMSQCLESETDLADDVIPGTDVERNDGTFFPWVHDILHTVLSCACTHLHTTMSAITDWLAGAQSIPAHTHLETKDLSIYITLSTHIHIRRVRKTSQTTHWYSRHKCLYIRPRVTKAFNRECIGYGLVGPTFKTSVGKVTILSAATSTRP
jgi:hypothetical protein